MCPLEQQSALSANPANPFRLFQEKEESTYQITSWQAIRNTCEPLIPEITACIDALDPDNNWPILAIRYEYGTPLFEDHRFFIRNTGKEKLSLENLTLPQELREKFYSPMQLPLGLVIEKSLEASIHATKQSIPLQCLTPGSFFGLENILPQPHITNHHYQLTSGAKHIFSLPKIGATPNHNRLVKTLQIKSPAPQHLTDHHNTFKAISRSPILQCDWKSCVFIFSQPWLQQRKDPAWQNFYYLLLQQWMKQHVFNTHQMLIPIILNDLSARANRYHDAFLATHFKQLLSIASNQTPGLCFASNDDAAPIKSLSKVYEEIYQLHPYHACFMHMQHIRNNHGNPLYYSLANHSQKDPFFSSKKTYSQRQTLLQLKDLIEQYQRYASNKAWSWHESFLAKLLSHSIFNFYHAQHDTDIQSSRKIASQFKCGTLLDAEFCYTSPLLQGIIEIRH